MGALLLLGIRRVLLQAPFNLSSFSAESTKVPLVQVLGTIIIGAGVPYLRVITIQRRGIDRGGDTFGKGTFIIGEDEAP